MWHNNNINIIHCSGLHIHLEPLLICSSRHPNEQEPTNRHRCNLTVSYPCVSYWLLSVFYSFIWYDKSWFHSTTNMVHPAASVLFFQSLRRSPTVVIARVGKCYYCSMAHGQRTNTTSAMQHGTLPLRSIPVCSVNCSFLLQTAVCGVESLKLLAT